MRNIFFAILVITFGTVWGQTAQDSLRVANRINYNNQSNLTIGGYVQIDYNEPSGSTNGNLDVHRLVMLFGYRFNDHVSFLTEIELEHVEEVYVEQAFVNYSFNTAFNIRGGLMLVPMGYINEYHEPPVFYGVERPGLDNDVVPTTWRELGIGVTGNLENLSLKYQAYLFNGFASYIDGTGKLKGKDGLRGGRQKGAESVINTPNLSLKLDYYGFLGLKVGLAGYFGETQTDDTSVEGATVGVSMVGLNAAYRIRNLDLRGQYIYTSLSDTEAYNDLTGKDLGSEIDGYYAEAAYNFMPLIDKDTDKTLSLFARYEQYDTHKNTEGDLEQNPNYDRNDITLGLDFKLTAGVVVKMDYQWFDNANPENTLKDQFNAGIGVMF
jgi:hypothetical protein